MVGAGLLPFPIPSQHARTEVQLVGQPSHRCRRCGRDVIGHEPQPRQGAQLHRQAQALPWRTPTARVDERSIRRGQREEPDQLIAGDLREAAQLDQFLLGEHPSRHTTTPPPLTACRRFPATLDSRRPGATGHIRWFFGAWTWYPPNPVGSAKLRVLRCEPKGRLPQLSGLRPWVHGEPLVSRSSGVASSALAAVA